MGDIGVFDPPSTGIDAPDVVIDSVLRTATVTVPYQGDGVYVSVYAEQYGCCGGIQYPSPNTHVFGAVAADAVFVFSNLTANELYGFYFRIGEFSSTDGDKNYQRMGAAMDTPPAPEIITDHELACSGGCYPFFAMLEPPSGTIGDLGACDAKLMIRRLPGDPSDSVSDPDLSSEEAEWGTVDLTGTGIAWTPPPKEIKSISGYLGPVYDSWGSQRVHSIVPGQWYETKWVLIGSSWAAPYDAEMDYFDDPTPTPEQEGPTTVFQAPYVNGSIAGNPSEWDEGTQSYYGTFEFVPSAGQPGFRCTWSVVSGSAQVV